MKLRLLLVAVVLLVMSVASHATQFLFPYTFTWGAPGDVPVPGDYDGDGKTDPAIFRPTTGDWFILKSSTTYGSFIHVHLGQLGDVPVPGDYYGLGKKQAAVFRPSTGEWFIDGSGL